MNIFVGMVVQNGFFSDFVYIIFFYLNRGRNQQHAKGAREVWHTDAIF